MAGAGESVAHNEKNVETQVGVGRCLSWVTSVLSLLSRSIECPDIDRSNGCGGRATHSFAVDETVTITGEDSWQTR